MDELSDLDLMLQSYTEVSRQEEFAEEVLAPPPPPEADAPSLSETLRTLSPLPPNALFLGLARDGLPILLNLDDPLPGPILAAGDSASGKTTFLRGVARAAEALHPSSLIQYVVLTSKPEEWQAHDEGHNAGIYKIGEPNAAELLQALEKWARENRGGEQHVLLFVDDLDALLQADDAAAQNSLRWLFLRGTNRRVWTFVAWGAERIGEQKDWLSAFRTRVFGAVKDEETARLLAGISALDGLSAGEFAIREEERLLKFEFPIFE
ncbi:MAG: hypothetical protein LC099_06940 [Anaerolineales bacterium]|nr:hypothetical protein [Anaerolineales bacterium]